jgi:hypothetical protein
VNVGCFGLLASLARSSCSCSGEALVVFEVVFGLCLPRDSIAPAASGTIVGEVAGVNVGYSGMHSECTTRC